MSHKPRYEARCGGLYADAPDGPRTFHEIWWEYSCGKLESFASKQAKERAAKADSKQ